MRIQINFIIYGIVFVFHSCCNFQLNIGKDAIHDDEVDDDSDDENVESMKRNEKGLFLSLIYFYFFPLPRSFRAVNRVIPALYCS